MDLLQGGNTNSVIERFFKEDFLVEKDEILSVLKD